MSNDGYIKIESVKQMFKDLLGLDLKPQHLRNIANQCGWRKYKTGRQTWYNGEDVFSYVNARRRMSLQQKLGTEHGKKAVTFYDDFFDYVCPECGAFAQIKKPELTSDIVWWIGGGPGLKWLCLKGHQGRATYDDLTRQIEASRESGF